MKPCGLCQTSNETLLVLDRARPAIAAGRMRCPDCLGTQLEHVHDPRCRYIQSAMEMRIADCTCRGAPS